MNNRNKFNDGNKSDNSIENNSESKSKKETGRFWYFPFFSVNVPTQKVRASAGNIWWSFSVMALVFIWCFHAVAERNWLFLFLGIAGGAAAEFFLIRDFIRTRRKEKEEKSRLEKTCGKGENKKGL